MAVERDWKTLYERAADRDGELAFLLRKLVIVHHQGHEHRPGMRIIATCPDPYCQRAAQLLELR